MDLGEGLASLLERVEVVLWPVALDHKRRRRGAAGRRDRRRVRERRGAAHRAGRVGAAAAQEGAHPRLVRRVRAHGRGGRPREHGVAGGDPRRRLPASAVGLEPGRAASAGGSSSSGASLAAGPPLARAAARRRRPGRLHGAGLPAVARARRGRARRAPRRRAAGPRRGARAERGALRHLPAQGLAPGAARGHVLRRIAPPRSTGALLPRAGLVCLGPARGRGASPAASRRACRAAAASAR